MKIYPNLDSLPKDDRYSFTKLFSSSELSGARWYVTATYNRNLIEVLVDDLGGGEIRSHEETSDTFFFAIVAE